MLSDGRSLVGCVAFEGRLDNSRTHIYSADFNPLDTRHRTDLLQAAISVCDAMEGEADGAEIAGQLKDFVSDDTKKAMVRCIQTASGARVPGIFKNAREYG